MVLVTGGARRIGAAIGRRLGEAGWHVVIHCHRSVEDAQALAVSLPSAEVCACDLADGDAVREMIDGIAARHEDWRVLVNSAAVFRDDHADALQPEMFAEAMRVNAEMPMRMAQQFLQQSRSKAGRRIIQLTDQKIANSNPDFFSYTMSKHAVAAGNAMLAMAARPGDRIHSLAPGAILPSFDQSAAEAEISHRMNPLGRRTTLEDVADAALFLATGPLANGQALFVDSGQHLVPQARDVIFLARGT